MRRFLFLLSLCSAFVGCQRGNTPELPAEADFDGDGVRNADDCAPWNDAVAGDFDGDGWLDRRCLEMWEAGNPNVFLRGPVERHHDCDDRDPARHPWLGPDGQPDFYEHAPDPDSFAYEACDGAEMPPAWAWDGIDNDCDPEGKVDVADWDHDSFTSTALGGGDCNDCRPTVHPDIDEHAVVQLGESVCPVYMYDDIDNDCDPTTRDDDFDGDGVEAGWDAGSACGAVINATTGLPLSELATGDDCDDIEVTIYGGAPEFCDLVDQDCDGDPLNGFLAGDLGPVVYVNAANAGVDAFVATGQSPELGLPDLASAMASVATCPEVVLEPGDYTERVRLDLVVFREEDAVPEGVDPDAHGNADTHPAPPAAGAPESVEGVDRTDVGALVGHTVRIRGAGPGVSLRGDGTRALEVWLLASQTLELQDLELVGRTGGVSVSGGALVAHGVDVLGIESAPGAALEHRAGVYTEWRDGVAVGNRVGTRGAADFRSATIAVSDLDLHDSWSSTAGAGLRLEGFLTAEVRRVHATGNVSGGGGGAIDAAGGELVLSDLTLTGNGSRGPGGAVHAFVRSAVVAPSSSSAGGVTIFATDNTAEGDGGAVALTGEEVAVDGVVCADNISAGSGGCLFVESDAVQVSGVRGSGDLAASRGGSLALGATGDLQASGLSVDCGGTGTSATHGGGLAVAADGRLEMSEVEVSACSAEVHGGGVYVGPAGQLDIAGAWTLTGNTAGSRGGGLYASVTDKVTLTSGGRLSLLDNMASSDGGGAWFDADELRLASAHVDARGNRAGGSGGGLACSVASVATLGGPVLSDNAAGGDGGGVWATALHLSSTGMSANANVAESGDGGGAWLQGIQTLSLVAGAFSDNSAADGGGAYLTSDDTITVDGGTWSANTASSSGGGALLNAAVSSVAGGTVWTENTAESGGGLALEDGVHAIDDADFSANAASGDGGQVLARAVRSFDLQNTSLTGAGTIDAGGSGGGIYVTADQATLGALSTTGLAAGDEGGCAYFEVGSFNAGEVGAWTADRCVAGANGGVLYLAVTDGLSIGVTLEWDESGEAIAAHPTGHATSWVDGTAGGAGHLAYLRGDGVIAGIEASGTWLESHPACEAACTADSEDGTACDTCIGEHFIYQHSGTVQVRDSAFSELEGRPDEDAPTTLGRDDLFHAKGSLYLVNVLVEDSLLRNVGNASGGLVYTESSTFQDNRSAGLSSDILGVTLTNCTVVAANDGGSGIEAEDYGIGHCVWTGGNGSDNDCTDCDLERVCGSSSDDPSAAYTSDGTLSDIGDDCNICLTGETSLEVVFSEPPADDAFGDATETGDAGDTGDAVDGVFDTGLTDTGAGDHEAGVEDIVDDILGDTGLSGDTGLMGDTGLVGDTGLSGDTGFAPAPPPSEGSSWESGAPPPVEGERTAVDGDEDDVVYSGASFKALEKSILPASQAEVDCTGEEECLVLVCGGDVPFGYTP